MSEEFKEKKLTGKQIFNIVKALCVRNRLDEAHAVIAKYKKENKSRAKLRPFTIEMLKVEQSFKELNTLFSEDTEPEKAPEVIENLQNVIPLLNPQEKANTHFWLGNCYLVGNTEDHEKAYQNFTSSIQLCVKGKEDSLLYRNAGEIEKLHISNEKKYESINLAYQKTSKNSVYDNAYIENLHRFGEKYYFDLLEKIQDYKTPYQSKNEYGEKAFNIINNLNFSSYGKSAELKKCSYKIKLLDTMEKLQTQHGDKSLACKTAARKQSFIYLSAQIRKRITGINTTNQNYR